MSSEGEVVETVNGEPQQEEDEIEAMRRKIKQMEEEAEKLKNMQITLEKEMSSSAAPNEKEEIDQRSVYVGNVDYSATPEELQNHFASCGTINRVTIICDKHTGHPKGFAYVEFLEKDSIENAVKLSDSVFHGRQIKVIPKRTNMPAFMLRGGAAPRGGFRGGRGGAMPPAPRGGFRGGRGGFRGRGRGGFHPYY